MGWPTMPQVSRLSHSLTCWTHWNQSPLPAGPSVTDAFHLKVPRRRRHKQSEFLHRVFSPVPLCRLKSCVPLGNLHGRTVLSSFAMPPSTHVDEEAHQNPAPPEAVGRILSPSGRARSISRIIQFMRCYIDRKSGLDGEVDAV